MKAAQLAQSEYMAEYGRQRIRVCADTFLNLAQVYEEQMTMVPVKDRGWEKSTARQEEPENGLRAKRLLRVRMAEERRNLARNFREIAQMMNSETEEAIQFIGLGKRRQKRISRELANEGLLARDLYLVRRGDGRVEVSIVLCVRGGRSRTAEEAADYLSILMDLRLVSVRRNPFFLGNEPIRYFFEEEPTYTYLTGTARAVKETEEQSGDNFAFFEAGDGNLTAVLSDGMGSGEEACRDSEMVADMTESLLETGIAPQMAVRLVNSALMEEGDADRLPTLDLCSIDLREGKCLFLKTGAACGYIKRGSAVETIGGGSLPLGTFGEPVIESAQREVSGGDMIVMVSDGLTEGWAEENREAAGVSGEERIRRFLTEVNVVSPVELANRLLRYCVTEFGGRIRDDCTVLVIGIWENERV